MAVGEAEKQFEEENVEEMTEESVENDDPEEDGDEEQDGGDDGDEEEEDEEEPVDPVEEIREKCAESPACAKLKEMFEACGERVNSRQNTEENCAQELLDFVHCQDVCVSKSLFSNLK